MQQVIHGPSKNRPTRVVVSRATAERSAGQAELLPAASQDAKQPFETCKTSQEAEITSHITQITHITHLTLDNITFSFGLCGGKLLRWHDTIVINAAHSCYRVVEKEV